MQAYANVATPPVRKVSQQTSKVYWEFRAAESAKGDDKNPTWYTVRVFKDEDPKLAKGDFVVFTGKLKNDVFMSRDGKPMGVLTVMAFQLAKIAKDGKRKELAKEEAAAPGATETPAANAQPDPQTPVRKEGKAETEKNTRVEAPLAEPRTAESGLPVIDPRLLPQ